jgi:hypothetical protein
LLLDFLSFARRRGDRIALLISESLMDGAEFTDLGALLTGERVERLLAADVAGYKHGVALRRVLLSGWDSSTRGCARGEVLSIGDGLTLIRQNSPAVRPFIPAQAR